MLDAYRTHGEHFILGDGKVCASEKSLNLLPIKSWSTEGTSIKTLLS